MNFVEMEVYNKLYKELSASDDAGGTKISHDFTDENSVSFSTKIPGQVKIVLTGSPSGSYRRIIIYLSVDGAEEQFEIFEPAGAAKSFVFDVVPQSNYRVRLENQGVALTSARIESHIVEKQEKFIKFD